MTLIWKSGIAPDARETFNTIPKRNRIQKSGKQHLYREIQRLCKAKDSFLKKFERLKDTILRELFVPKTSNLGWNCQTSSSFLNLDSHSRAESLYHSESIESVVYRHAHLPPSFAISSNRWAQNLGRHRLFHVEILQQYFDLILPSTIKNSNGIDLTTDVEAITELESDFEKSVFLARMPTWAHRVILKADPEDLVKRLLPDEIAPAGARHVAVCFWSFLCIVDDLTENGDCYNCIETCVESLSTASSLSSFSVILKSLSPVRDLSEKSKLDDCKTIITAFYNVVNGTALFSNEGPSYSNVGIIEEWKVDFWLEVLKVIKALQAEKLLHGRHFSMREWLHLRLVTISARPFMVLLRASLGLPATLSISISPHINQLQVLVQAVLGLQNDILGWQKDHSEGNPLNAVEVLIGAGILREEAFQETLNAHNNIVQSLLGFARIECSDGAWTIYSRTIVSFCNAMAEWMLTSRRYRTQQVVVPGLIRLMYHDPKTMHDGLLRL